jgi:Uma2 family endonuclease
MSSRLSGDSFEEETMPAVLNLLDERVWTVDEVAKLPEDLPYELIDGRLILTPSPTHFHQFVGIETAIALREFRPAEILVGTDQSVLVDSGSEPRPDVLLIREEGAGPSPVLAADVLLAVEIISPDSTVRDRQDKMKLYAYAGIPAYWIIDPLAERVTFTEFLLSEGRAYHQRVQADCLITIDRPWKITLDLPSWTRYRDRIRDRARPNG